MNRRKAIGIAGSVVAAQAAPKVRDQFVGVYQLISCERKFKDGRIEYPYGQKPVGRITYDKAGRMSAQLMQPGRRSTVAPGITFSAGTTGCDELRVAAESFIAYYGRFDIDEATTTVTHHVEACLVPSWVGTDLKRKYRFTARQLVLSVETTNLLELVWEREAD